MSQDKNKTYKYGAFSEKVFYNILKSYCPDAVMTDRYDEFDYIVETDNRIILIELKTRTILKDTFDTTLFPMNKIECYYKYKKTISNPHNKKIGLIICIGFPDVPVNIKEIDDEMLSKINFSYYMIQYTTDKCKYYKLTNNPYENYKNINIVIDDLKPAEYYLDIIKQ